MHAIVLVRHMRVFGVFTVYAHAIVDQIISWWVWQTRDKGVTGWNSSQRDRVTARAIALRELTSRVEACVADGRPVVCAYVCPWSLSLHLATTPPLPDVHRGIVPVLGVGSMVIHLLLSKYHR